MKPIPLATWVDEQTRYDLVWIERKIREVEDGPRTPYDLTADKAEARRQYLERLYRIRDRLKGDS
jgi:hypothetical protein